MLFGDKQSFAIELEFTKSNKKYKLRFWVNGKSIGSFTKSGELDYSIDAYKKFTSNKTFYYLPIFDSLTPTRIFYYLTDMSLLLTDSDEDFAEAKERQKFFLFFGKQFTNSGESFLLLYKDGKVTFLITPAKSEKVISSEIGFKTFTKVFDEYIDYCYQNNLL